MSDEIEIQTIIAAMRRRWWLIAAAVAVALVIALVLATTQPKRYQATATLLAQAPRLQWRFDLGILPVVDPRQNYQQEFLAISRSDAIAEMAAEELAATGDMPAITAADLKAATAVRAGEGTTLLVTATASDPGQAATMANAWSNALVEVARSITGIGSDLANYQAELDRAAQKLEAAEQELSQARVQTGLYNDLGQQTAENSGMQSLREEQLEAKNQLLAQYLSDLDSLRHLTTLVETETADLSQLPWELLNGPILMQRGVLTPAIGQETQSDPARLLDLLRSEEVALAATAEQLTLEATALQTELAQDWLLYTEAHRAFNLANETYVLFARKVEEASAQERIDPDRLLIATKAVAPSAPIQRRQIAQLAVAAVIGLILGIILALALELRGRTRQEQAEPARSALSN